FGVLPQAIVVSIVVDDAREGCWGIFPEVVVGAVGVGQRDGNRIRPDAVGNSRCSLRFLAVEETGRFGSLHQRVSAGLQVAVEIVAIGNSDRAAALTGDVGQ